MIKTIWNKKEILKAFLFLIPSVIVVALIATYFDFGLMFTVPIGSALGALSIMKFDCFSFEWIDDK